MSDGESIRGHIPKLDWVEGFHTLAARRARLLRVFGDVGDYRQPRWYGEREVPPLSENRWRELWRQAVSGHLEGYGVRGALRGIFAKDKEHPGWPAELWLEFADAPVLRLNPFEDVIRLQLDENAPREPGEPEPEPSPEGSFVKELTALPPFADVAGTPLEAINVIYWGGPPHGSPGGVRLQFERGDVWIMALLGGAQIYDRRPPYWDKDKCEFG